MYNLTVADIDCHMVNAAILCIEYQVTWLEL
jgi:hypothetical protein